MDWFRNYYQYIRDNMCNCKLIQLSNRFRHFDKGQLVNMVLFHSLHRNIQADNYSYMKYHFVLLHHRSGKR